MKRMVITAILLTLGGTALAGSDDGRSYPPREQTDQRRYDDRRYDNGRDDRNERYEDRRYSRPGFDDRYDQRGWRDDRGRFERGRYSPPRGYAPRYWRRGDRLPRGYMGRPYIVHDYHTVRIHAPPRGYHWVRVNHDVVLAAIATGIVLDVLYNRFY